MKLVAHSRIALLFVAACGACATQSTPESEGSIDTAESGAPSDPLRRRFDKLVPQLLAQHRVPGLAVAVVRAGELDWVAGYGLAELDERRTVSGDTVFNAGSISKPVTAWGVMLLVEQGRLELDEPVATYLQRWQLPDSGFDASGITVRRLLSHTAGLTVHSIPGFAVNAALPTLEATLAGEYTASTYTEAGTPVEQFADAGTQWRYSGGGFVLLQLLVEEVSGRPFEQFMDEQVLRPLGMVNSRFGWDDALAADAAVPYRDDLVPLPTFRFSGTAGAGLYTDAQDLARFAAALLPSTQNAPGRGVLQPGSVSAMLEHVELLDGTPTRCGLGYFLAPPGAQPREAFHGGSNAGWQAVFVSLPDDGDAIAILANSNNAGDMLPELVCTWGEIEAGKVLSGCQ